MSDVNAIRKQLYELRRQGREKSLRLAGIDVSKVRALEEEIDEGYEKLVKTIQTGLKEEGKANADMHNASFESVQTLIHRDLEMYKVATTELRPFPGPFRYRPCIYPNIATPAPPPQDSIDLDLDVASGGGASGSVTYNSANNIAHPLVDTRGKGTGTINTAHVKTSFRFSFMPTTDKSYCVRPIVHMNGHYLLWTWGACGGTAEDLGTGTVKVVLRVRVDQLSLPVKQTEHTVLEETAAQGQDVWSGFGYDSEVDGGAALSVYLQGGHEAVVWVECDCYAQIANHGRARVDMQTGSYFYYKVPEVRWGYRSLWWFIPI